MTTTCEAFLLNRHFPFGLSMTAWFSDGVVTECQDLLGFIVLDGGLIPPDGLDNFNSDFLLVTYQGSISNPMIRSCQMSSDPQECQTALGESMP